MRIIPLSAVALLALAACDRADPPVANRADPAVNVAQPAPAPEASPAPAPAPPAGNAAEPVASTTIPAAYQGVFDQTAAACTAASSIHRLTVSGGELRFHESLADVQTVIPDSEGAIRVAANYSGEGMTWSNIQRLALSDGGTTLTMTGEGEPVARKRCG